MGPKTHPTGPHAGVRIMGICFTVSENSFDGFDARGIGGGRSRHVAATNTVIFAKKKRALGSFPLNGWQSAPPDHDRSL